VCVVGAEYISSISCQDRARIVPVSCQYRASISLRPLNTPLFLTIFDKTLGSVKACLISLGPSEVVRERYRARLDTSLGLSWALGSVRAWHRHKNWTGVTLILAAAPGKWGTISSVAPETQCSNRSNLLRARPPVHVRDAASASYILDMPLHAPGTRTAQGQHIPHPLPNPFTQKTETQKNSESAGGFVVANTPSRALRHLREGLYAGAGLRPDVYSGAASVTALSASLLALSASLLALSLPSSILLRRALCVSSRISDHCTTQTC
jgi:hypothetical protein